MIDGVTLTPLRQIFDERGKVMHMLREDSPIFSRFGEIYFSCTHPGVVKAWHLHREMTLNYAVIFGEIKFVLFDDRPSSSTRGEIQELFISPENYVLVTVPPNIWNGFKSVGTQTAIVANCATLPHNPDEIERRTVFDASIPYDWELKHR
ncbi:MAG: dTDP-4-dehydrorhamnose 3,5-epimerase [Gallionellales bacterium 35-53-114]|jgi:dTDP-4-dehydrorhamnose 3,5-epimerase|nr:MAG: dTDP-4-dehydrorhamnose 3,5-epimerase [Gallionellales bacterium 35-53-114]OYZ63429.1 MAG: dTDP-4-dehydrorhamnose 3,5-epimerase [Gallionellales bacterium 24-53-125]OZB10958.1 MAG: dTDP-4-dehydrorhamnose 3,5-epimerase [Gallionellales bacterium 39-52-133]HQS58858.1 dTDP-4-dehydrorhamnose 3,5-epimerase family protein [Gallionellaceae bacterium]HQS75757.1 dTDP-4-dehydrorhamnose 3,5-epimerase family protein [Gallionellaceae bacterium]